MYNPSVAGPASNNIVVYSQSGRASHLGVLLDWLGTEKKVVYGFERSESLWANQAIIIPATADAYAQMCSKHWWTRFLAGTIDHRFVTAEVFDGRMSGNVCELRFSPKSKEGTQEVWVPLTEVILVAHFDARQPAKR
jgi:hypothetical protein